jgi:hypothetical protein
MTEAILFDPASVAVDPARPAVPGTCTASLYVPRAGAYGCMTETGASWDPCFVLAEGQLGCGADPISNSWSLLVAPSQPLPATADELADPVAFYVELAPGHPPCRMGRASPLELGGEPVTYICEAPGAVLVGLLVTVTDPWQAQYVTTDTQGDTVTSGPSPVDVVRAWMY